MSQQKDPNHRIGLALAGGGPEGAVYEIGAVRALEVAIEGLDLNKVPVLVGVSAGAFVASNLANGMTPSQMVRAIVKTDPGEHPFVPQMFFTPALGEITRSGLSIPRHLIGAVQDYLGNWRDHSVLKSMTQLSRILPTALFDNRPIRRYLEKIYSKEGRTNDFRVLKKKLFVVASDLDSGESVVFGKPGYDHVPISVAVQASTALPVLYPPVDIDGRHYVDGVLLRTLHASTVLENGVDLALCINPIVPVDTSNSVEAGYMRRGKLIDRGMPTLLSQTLRTLIHSRMKIGFRRYGTRYEGADVILLEPSSKDYRMFFTNIFSFANRKSICEHAYASTLEDIKNRQEELAPVLARIGLRLRTEVLNGPTPDLWLGVGLASESPRHPVTFKLDEALRQLEHTLAAKSKKAESTSEPQPARI